jgi:hypothetical protein
LLNAIPFLLNSVGRYTFSFEYALSARYVFFTLFGTLLIVGATLSILWIKISVGAWPRLLPVIILVLIILGQIFTTPFWQKDYLRLSRLAFECYQKPERFSDAGPFIANPYHPVGPNQISGIKKFLTQR